MFKSSEAALGIGGGSSSASARHILKMRTVKVTRQLPSCVPVPLAVVWF